MIHPITNYVAVSFNITPAIGAFPVMADDIGNVEAIASISQAIFFRNEITLIFSLQMRKASDAEF
ncbi:hydroxyethylthiazole kinase [Caproicibacter fermentans]|uniref:hydroxyethylthiazole kinase n=1 Tax=Caproicibacter fermentans TaxID=2576756 RepID=A0A7G8TG24_9FIRM|nr:hydroxyethylthiazole kinase [Caproicibacter fermentans]